MAGKIKCRCNYEGGSLVSVEGEGLLPDVACLQRGKLQEPFIACPIFTVLAASGAEGCHLLTMSDLL